MPGFWDSWSSFVRGSYDAVCHTLPTLLEAPLLAVARPAINHPRWFAVLACAGLTVALSAVAAPFMLTVVLPGLGFASTGVVAGSIAAAIQSSIGSVAAGSLFALMQSAGAGGAGTLVITLVAAAVSAGLSCAVLERLEAVLHALVARHPQALGPALRAFERVVETDAALVRDDDDARRRVRMQRDLDRILSR